MKTHTRVLHGGESEELRLHNKACCVNSVMVELWVVNLLT